MILLVLSGIFPATETAVHFGEQDKDEKRSGEHDDEVLARARITGEPMQFLTTILIGNNIANIATTSIATVMFIKAIWSLQSILRYVVVTV